MNYEFQMTNAGRSPKTEVPRGGLGRTGSSFVIRHSSLFQHTQLLASRVPGVAPRLRLAALVGFLLPLAAHAETAASSSLGMPDAGTSLLRLCGALVVVFTVFFGLVWLYRNWQHVLRRSGRMPLLNVLEARSLGNRHTLYVVTCGDQRFLVGSSPNGLNLLSPLSATTTGMTTTTVTDPAPAIRTPSLANFADTLQAMLERK